MSLNSISVGSGPAQLALEKQLKSSARHYKEMFTKFVVASTDDPAMQRAAIECAVGLFAREPDAYSTLVHIPVLEGELGVIVANATIFAIAATTTYFVKGTKLIGGGIINFKNETGEKPYAPRMTWEEYVTYMEDNHPNATAVARQIGVGVTQKAKENVVAVMGYLIDQGTRQ